MRASIERRSYSYLELTINRLCSQRGERNSEGGVFRIGEKLRNEEEGGGVAQCIIGARAIINFSRIKRERERERKGLFLNSNNREIAVIASDIRGLAQKEGKFNERMGIFMMIKRFAIAKKLHG